MSSPIQCRAVKAKRKMYLADDTLSATDNSTCHSPEASRRFVQSLRNQATICFRCRRRSHQVCNCPLISTNPKFPNIYCRCGHGFCKIRTSKNIGRNYGRSYYACPIQRGKKCKEFVKWCDYPVYESQLRPPLYKYPMCSCGAGVCRKVKETRGPNEGSYFFACSIGEGCGGCNFRLWEDTLLAIPNISALKQAPGNQNTDWSPQEAEIVTNTDWSPQEEVEIVTNTDCFPQEAEMVTSSYWLPQESEMVAGSYGSPQEAEMVAGSDWSPQEAEMVAGSYGSPQEAEMVTGSDGLPQVAEIVGGANGNAGYLSTPLNYNVDLQGATRNMMLSGVAWKSLLKIAQSVFHPSSATHLSTGQDHTNVNYVKPEEHIQHYEEEKVRPGNMRDVYVKVEAASEASQQPPALQSFEEEASRLNVMLQKVEEQIACWEVEAKEMKTRLGEIKARMMEAEESVKKLPVEGESSKLYGNDSTED